MQQPKSQYARNGDVSIAYQVVGDGPLDLVIVPGFVSHVDLCWTRWGDWASLPSSSLCAAGASASVDVFPGQGLQKRPLNEIQPPYSAGTGVSSPERLTSSRYGSPASVGASSIAFASTSATSAAARLGDVLGPEVFEPLDLSHHLELVAVIDLERLAAKRGYEDRLSTLLEDEPQLSDR